MGRAPAPGTGVLLVVYPLCYALFGAGFGADIPRLLADGRRQHARRRGFGSGLAGFTAWWLAGGAPAYFALCRVLRPGGHLSQLGGTAARLPRAGVAGLEWWKRVIKGAWVVLSLLSALLIACLVYLSAATNPSYAVASLISGVYCVLFLVVTCTFWFSLKVAGALALHPTNRAYLPFHAFARVLDNGTVTVPAIYRSAG